MKRFSSLYQQSTIREERGRKKKKNVVSGGKRFSSLGRASKGRTNKKKGERGGGECPFPPIPQQRVTHKRGCGFLKITQKGEKTF